MRRRGTNQTQPINFEVKQPALLSGDIVIVHSHGAKPEQAVCIFDFIERTPGLSSKVRDSPDPHYFEGSQHNYHHHIPNDAIEECGMVGAPYVEFIVMLIEVAYKADAGKLFRWMWEEQERLVPTHALPWA